MNLLYQNTCFYPVIHHAAVDQDKVLGERYTLGAHTHGVYHLNVYTRSAGEFLQEGRFYPAKMGTLVVVSPWEKHDFVTRSGSFQYSEITFSFVNPNGQVLGLPLEKLLSIYTGADLKLKGTRQEFNHNQISQFISILSEIIDSLESKTDLGEFNAYRSLAQLLDFIIMNACTTKTGRILLNDPASAAKDYIDSQFVERISIKKLATISYVSEGHLIKLFKKKFKTTPVVYQRNVRVEAAKTLLKCSNMTGSQIAKRIGYDSNYYFHRVFKKTTGLTPKQYRSNNSSGPKRKTKT